MGFTDDIFSLVWDISDWFYEAYLTVAGWVWPFNEADVIFLVISRRFWDLLTPIAHFGDWVSDVTDTITSVLTWDNIRDVILGWVPKLELTVDWFVDRWRWFQQEAGEWWASTLTTVKDLIAIAVEGLDTLKVAWSDFWTITWPELLSVVNSLRAEWDEFRMITFPTLVSFTWLNTWWTSTMGEVQGLINSAFTVRESLWAGWQEIKEQVFDFFSDPLEFLWVRFTDWFLGPEV